VLLVSPSLRQSRELFAKVIGFLKELEPVEQPARTWRGGLCSLLPW
jgi:hypothetical protein